jgi:PelA/Pel-15E family pectate lyase
MPAPRSNNWHASKPRHLRYTKTLHFRICWGDTRRIPVARARLGEAMVWFAVLLGVLWPVCFAVGADTGKFLSRPEAWFGSPEARQVTQNILSFQAESGGWPKNASTTAGVYTGDRKALQATYDNGATTDELRFLARVHVATGDAVSREAFEKGLRYILVGQYPQGGWPQFHPPGTGYHRHITFNDDAMVRILRFLREVVTEERYAFVGGPRRRECADAFERGLACVLKCQVRIGGRPTVWCAQHDEIDFRPRAARSFELATLSGAESVGLTRLLMSVRDPSPEVVGAVEGAVAWFREARLAGIRVETVNDPKGPKGVNRVVVSDPQAPPLWARFYSIEGNRPVFADRDGVARERLEDIGYERRNGYAWYGNWPQRLLEVDYPAWRAGLAARQAP